MYCRSLFLLFHFYFWSMCCLFESAKQQIILVSSIYVLQCLSRVSCNVITFKTAATFCPLADSDYPLDTVNLLLYWMDLDCKCLAPL